MSIYIEPLVLQNLLVTYLICASSYRFLRLKCEWYRFLLAAVCATAVTLVFPMFTVNVFIGVPIKIALGIIIAIILFVGKVNLLKGILTFYLATFLYGGAVFFVGCLQYKNAVDALTKPLSLNFLIVTGSATALYCLLKSLSVAHHRRSDCRARVYPYRLVLSGREIRGNGFMDTGNRLYDSKSGLPIVVLGLKTFIPQLTDEELAWILSGHADRAFKGARKMQCKSVGSSSDLWLIQPDVFEVYSDADGHILYDVMVGLSMSSVAGGDNYDAILHPALASV